ncbi:7996_t:CDS:1, partial [Gigaspora margarita]
MSDPFEKENNAVAAWFIGPRAENERFFKEFCQIILSKQQEGRKQYFQNDPIFITKEMQESIEFKSIMEKLKDELNSLMEALEIKTVPFWSPRYMAHMSMEPTLASNLGYMGALQYNQNNVTVEASPLTTYIEILVGKQLCEMLGFNTTNIENELSWGHITCDGSVANLESI